VKKKDVLKRLGKYNSDRNVIIGSQKNKEGRIKNIEVVEAF